MPRGNWWVVLLALGCSSSLDESASRACTPGAQQACACVGGPQGAQRCRDDGSGFAECICPDGGSAELGGASAAGGSGGLLSASGGDSNPSGGGAVGGTVSTTGGVSPSGGATGGAFVVTMGGAASGTGGACTGIFAPVAAPPVNLIFIVDKSGSMGASGQSPDSEIDRRWNPMVYALKTFFGSVTSPALQVSVTLFPAPCTLDLDAGGGCLCSADEYNPSTVQANAGAAVPLTQVVGHAQTFTDLFNNSQPNGGTPTIAALQGSYSYASSVQAASPAGATYVVLITDGLPGFGVVLPDGGVVGAEGCPGNNVTTIAALAQSYAEQGVRTYVFRLGTVANLDQVATAGGTALVTIDLGDPAATTQQLVSTLNGLPKPVFSCTQPVPTATGLDFNQLNVYSTSSSSSDRQLIPNNPNCSGGDGSGWSISGNDIVLCAPTCNQLKQDPSTALTVQLGCPTLVLAP